MVAWQHSPSVQAGNRRVPSDASTTYRHGLQESFSRDPRCGESDPRDHSQLREVRLESWAGWPNLGTVGDEAPEGEPDAVEQQCLRKEGVGARPGNRPRLTTPAHNLRVPKYPDTCLLWTAHRNPGAGRVQQFSPIHLLSKDRRTAQTFDLLEKYSLGKAGQSTYTSVPT